MAAKMQVVVIHHMPKLILGVPSFSNPNPISGTRKPASTRLIFSVFIVKV